MKQKARSVGKGNTIVQIVGDGNFVGPAHPHLRLTRFVNDRQIRQDLDRLSPYKRSTPLLGREAELASLHAYLNDPRPLSARVLIGGGGSGKTRLALELCEQVSAKGWNAGFVTCTTLRRFFNQQNLCQWSWQKPTLIVVDDAAEDAKLLGKWLEELADCTAASMPALRLLLLERHASTETGWWTTVFASGRWGAARKHALLDPVDPVPIRPLVHAEDRLALLQSMLKQASPDEALRVPLNDPAFRDKLMQLTWGGDPLFLMMAALAMVQFGHAKALTLGRIDLADTLAEHEFQRLENLAEARSLDSALVQHLTACVTLMQGMGRTDFEHFAASEKTAIHRPSGGDAAALADLLQEALPRPDGIAPVLPDLIGEALIVRAMRGDAGTAAVLRCHAALSHPVVESVIRCVQDFGQQSPAPLQWIEAIVRALDDDEDALAALAEGLPMQSVLLSDLTLKVALRLQTLRAGREDTPTNLRALTLIRLAIAQAQTGQREEALRTAQAATDLFRELANERPDMFRPDLATSLNNLAAMLGELGQHELALQAAQEATAIRHELATRWPDVFRSDLALSLHHLAVRLSAMGQREFALLAAQESVNIRRDLAAQRPDVFRSDLAGSLRNLATRLSEMGQREPALRASQESVDIRRELAAQRPDVFRPDLAESLNNLANRLSEMGQHKPALGAAQEAVNIRRELAAQRPRVFNPDLAVSLNNLAYRLSELGQHKPALEAVLEATKLYRELAVPHPAMFRPGLAMSLNNLANRLSELDQPELALEAIQEAVDIRRELAAQQPQVFRPALAVSLIFLALRTRDANQPAEALSLAREALTTLQPEFLSRPTAHARLMQAIQSKYRQLCEAAEQDPDLDVALGRPTQSSLPTRKYLHLCEPAEQDHDLTPRRPMQSSSPTKE